VKFDRKEVLRLDELVLSAVPRSEKLAAERRRMEGGQQVPIPWANIFLGFAKISKISENVAHQV
jgi:hypothetical protein